ncbi:MAG: hypothetical protein Q7T17_15315 [Microbacterium sp.]|uniref:glycosyltransferase n=1 Tax=Microbacterium sp. TaxID=51671 RepID=UPI002722D040|nr:glycosyltransferase [Microbacterium sp.]MDO8384330.1 hypothetical protein [Microbacterium sp.]
MPEDAAVWHYVARGFRRGLSLNPLFDEVFAGGGLPEVFRVPALYAYLVGERATIAVHPWWNAVDSTRADGVPGLERAWGDQSTELSLRVGELERSLAVSEMRELALGAARTWSGLNSAGIDAAPEGPESPLAVIRMVQARDRRYHLKLSQAARLVESGRGSVSVSMVGVDASQWVSGSLLAAIEPRLGVHLHTNPRTWAGVVTDEVRRLRRQRTVVVLDARAEFADAEIEDLAAEARQALTIPAHRALNGTLVGIGGARVGSGPAYRILAGHPHEDAALISDRILAVPLATGRTFAVDLDAYRGAGGVRANGGEELEDLSRRLARAGTPSRVLLDVLPVLEEPELPFGQAKRKRSSHAPAVEPDRLRAEAILVAAGFDVQGWRARGSDGPAPVLTWRRPTPGARRWAIKICAPPGRQGAVWGDTHFARGLASALRRRGHYVVVDSFDASDRDTGYLDDVSVVVRGPYRIDAPKWGTSLQWIISHPDHVTRAEAGGFDRVFAASASWSRRKTERWRIRIDPLLEATDTDLFRPAGLERGSDIVFVGTARGIARPSVVVPLEAGISVRVYGPDWRPFIPQSAIAARSISNADLPARYETASIVLNDQWPAMRREGFIAMRPFDVVAVGGRVISEEVDEIEDIFDGAVIAYRDAHHLVELLRTDPDDLFPPAERLAEISERIRREHSFDARAAVLDAAADEVARRTTRPRR